MTIQIETGAADTNVATMLYQNVFEDGTVTVSSETTDGAGLNSVEDTTFDFWTPAGVPANLDIDYGDDVECDCLGIAAHTAGTDGATIEVQYSDDDVIYTTAATIDPLTDDTIMVIFPAVSARYWRVRVTSAVCSIGVVKLGKRLVMPCGVLTGGVPVNHSEIVELMTNTSVRGQYLGTRIKRVGAEINPNFGLIDADFVDNYMSVFEAHFNSGRTFFYAGSPSEWPNDYGYGWRNGGELRPSTEEGGTMYSVSMGMGLYVEQ